MKQFMKTYVEVGCDIIHCGTLEKALCEMCVCCRALVWKLVRIGFCCEGHERSAD